MDELEGMICVLRGQTAGVRESHTRFNPGVNADADLLAGGTFWHGEADAALCPTGGGSFDAAPQGDTSPPAKVPSPNLHLVASTSPSAYTFGEIVDVINLVALSLLQLTITGDGVRCLLPPFGPTGIENQRRRLEVR